MGKCSVCGKKIEYNKYKVVNGDVYCPDCVPKTNFEKEGPSFLADAIKEEIRKAKEAAPRDCSEENLIISPEAATPEEIEKAAEEEAKEQFEKEMSGHGDTAETARNEPEPEEKPKRKRSKRKN